MAFGIIHLCMSKSVDSIGVSFRMGLFGQKNRVWALLAFAAVAVTMGSTTVSGKAETTANSTIPSLAGTDAALSAAILSGPGARYRLRLHHLHTGEDIDVVYKVGNQYVPTALAQLNHFLRDHRTEDVSHYDPKEFDVLHQVMAKLGKPNGVIDIVCGYRTPWSNNLLRTRAAVTGVAEHSQHMLAKAIDIRVPGVKTRSLRDVALSLHEGGVGYYPVSQFVHVDVGPVRTWSFGGRGD